MRLDQFLFIEDQLGFIFSSFPEYEYEDIVSVLGQKYGRPGAIQRKAGVKWTFGTTTATLLKRGETCYFAVTSSISDSRDNKLR